MSIESYRDLIVWQKSIRLAKCVHALTKTFPREEQYGLTSQLRRAAVSVPANIAEGNGRRSVKDYAHFISIAMGSAKEIDTLLVLSNEFSYANKEQTRECFELVDDVCRLLFRVRQKLTSGIHLPHANR